MERVAAISAAGGRADQCRRQKKEHERRRKNRKRLRIFAKDLHRAMAEQENREKQRQEEKWKNDLEAIQKEIGVRG